VNLDTDPQQAHATDGDRGGPDPGPDAYAQWLADNDLELRDGRLVRRGATGCACCAAFAAAHNNRPCSSCAHTAEDIAN
jgi:hypothetical protein